LKWVDFLPAPDATGVELMPGREGKMAGKIHSGYWISEQFYCSILGLEAISR
jgi:hypothetical protein